MSSACGKYGHIYKRNGVCYRDECGDYDEEFDCDDYDEEHNDRHKGKVAKNWSQANGENTTVWVVPSQLERAKDLLAEHGEDRAATTKILEILEKEFDYEKYDDHALDLLVVALRETRIERKAVANTACSTCDGAGNIQPFAGTGGDGCEDLRIACPDCDGTPHP